ncbi:gliding motility lipoprotein GldH [Prolixibacteraceae bacterium Z1-6]|uniref:Gliding motility lipoprotein GldH n=1 Tax=Draconibacterium aestuarii TaxID=2998507 RepID=A0A9X3J781_9BACT|nr:gliding motility lipoprotein GldH [Prolixibacteraceae bacterium Z1-6]
MKNVFQWIIVGCFLTVLSACDTNRVFDQYQPIPEDGWQKDSLVVFHIPIVDTIQNHNLYINIRNDINYQYSNVWLFVTIEQPGGIAIRDTFEMVVADASGKWLGEGFGGIKTREVIYRRNVYFPNSGIYKIVIQHGMRENNLEGISDIGFRVEEVK